MDKNNRGTTRGSKKWWLLKQIVYKFYHRFFGVTIITSCDPNSNRDNRMTPNVTPLNNKAL